jgi:sec-independent protein translocase protein TatB
MVGQWMGKARKMASEFQGQFQEAMREAEMADLKKSFDEVKDIASGNNVMTSLQKDVGDALAIDKPADAQVASAVDQPATSPGEAPVTPTTPADPTPSTFVEAATHDMANEPLVITREVQAASQEPAPDVLKDAKAS